MMRNRIPNPFLGASSQPGLGGLTGFILNAMDNPTYEPFKLHGFSAGDVILPFTTGKAGDGMACFSEQPFDFALFGSNLSIGRDSPGRLGRRRGDGGQPGAAR